MHYYTNLEGKSLRNFDEDFFESIKRYFKEKSSLTSIDSRDCAILFGLWWKFSYVEGKPSKDMIFNSLYSTYQSFSAEDLYQKAKEGGKKLGWKWIQKENTLYFRTLLLQGGIPLKNLLKYGTAYRKFLLKVIEQRPAIISDIADNYEVIKDLPMSTRNEIVFEAALSISRAIWDDTEEGREILDLLEQNQQRDLVDTLKKRKTEIEKAVKSQAKIKTFFELNLKSSEEANIVLKSVLPDKINSTSFAEMINLISDDELSASYNFFCDETLLATYRKGIKGDFIKYYSSLTPILWNPENKHLPELYFADTSGKKYFISSQIKVLPDPSIPTLWVQVEENRWIMLSKKNHNGDSAFVLTSEPSHCTEKSIRLIIEGKIFYLFEIQESTTLITSKNEYVHFKLSTTSFDWYIQETRPDWLHKANTVVVKALPKIYFFNDDGKRISDNQISKKWRRKGEYVWHEYNGSIPVGIIELQFCIAGVTEYEKVFNIGDSTLRFSSSDILRPAIYFNHNDLMLEVVDNSCYNISNTDKSIVVNITNTNQIPKYIKAYIKSKYGNLLFDILLPSKSIELVDKEDKVVGNNHIFLLNNIDGYRIISGENQTIKFYNEQYPMLIIRQTLQSGLIPLRNFNTIIQKLFLLADSMASGNIVVMEMQGKRIQFKAYNTRLSYQNEYGDLRQSEDKKLLINLKKSDDLDINYTPQSNYLLYAVPLNCELKDINSIELDRDDDSFYIHESINNQEFIVFDTNKDINCKILPTYVTTNQDYIISPPVPEVLYQNKLVRIAEFYRQLSDDSIDGQEWQKLYRYIEICNQFNLPFSAFDIIRAACSSSDICAKLFFFLICYSTRNEEFIRTCGKMEEELGFRFHWCSFESIQKNFNSIIDNHGNDAIGLILEKSSLIIDRKFLMFNNNNWKMPEGFHLNTSMNSMRQRLGESVINELPHWRPFIPETRKTIIPIDNKKLKIMTRCPIAIALVKLNLYESELPNGGKILDLWHLNNHEIRRNIIYCENLDNQWYDLAITYAINQIL